MSPAAEMIETKTYRQEILDPEAFRGRGLFDLRQRAFRRFLELGLPTRKTEAFRYMNLDPILNGNFIAAAPSATLDLAQIALSQESARLVFVDGLYAPQLSTNAAEIVVQKISDGMPEADLLGRGIERESNPFVCINSYLFQDAYLIRIPKQMNLTAPVHIILSQGKSAATVSYPRLLIVGGEGSKSNLVLSSVHDARHASLVNGVAGIFMERNAKLQLSLVRHEAGAAFELNSFSVWQKEGSTFEMTLVADSAAAIRDEVRVFLQGDNTSASVSGLNLLAGESKVFSHVDCFHESPHGSSRQLFKNILAGEAVAEFDSLVHVLRNAHHSDSQQLDRNLLLSDSARAYSRPQLKIDNDDVKCNHGAATGDLEPEQIFYLRSRGMDSLTAKYLLTFGFAEEVLKTLGSEELRTRLTARIQAQIKRIMGYQKG